LFPSIGLRLNFPIKHFLEIVVALLADPTTAINGHITLTQHVSKISIHKFGPAELAVVMIPVGSTLLVHSPLECNALKIFFLPLESPIGLINHKLTKLRKITQRR